MNLFLIITFLSASTLAYPMQYYSFSSSVGRGDGNSFTIEGEGRITGVRIWEHHNSYIAAIQLRFGYIWSKVVGNTHGRRMVDIELFNNEYINQVTGKFNPHNYIYQLYVSTSRARLLLSGQTAQETFNMYPAHEDAELIKLSGRYNHWGITSLAAHWGIVQDQASSNSKNSAAR